MTILLFHPLLAQGESCTAVAVAFVVITIIGWIMQLVTGAKQGQQRAGRPVRPPRPRDERLQSEIDVFLEEVEGRRRPPQRPQPRQSAGTPILEVVPEERAEPARHSTIRSRAAARHSTPPTTEARREQAPPRSAPAGSGTDVRKPRRDFADVPRHLVPESDYLTSATELGGAEHLGAFVGGSGGSGESGQSIGPVHPLVAVARNPQGMKQAIVLSEILGRPLARREPKGRG